MENYKKYYTEFLKQNEGILHFACHSHHYWPDITRAAQNEYWDDSAKYVDEKWGHIFVTKVPKAQKLIANILNISHPEQLVFAPNTHEFVTRLLSCFPSDKKIKVLTTDSEFYSFNRQIDRIAEEGSTIIKVATLPFDNFIDRFIEKISSNEYDLIFFSQVFFNSGFEVQDLERIVKSVKNKKTLIVIDGYHSFMATPTSLKAIEDRVFYIAGSYKYAQGGEGCCFMHVPKGTKLRPINTGWFAQIENLGKEDSGVAYSDDGMRFAGSTMDFTALYRLISVLDLFDREGINVSKIHGHVQELQRLFIEGIKAINHPLINLENLLISSLNEQGHFLTFNLPGPELTEQLATELKKHQVQVDYRSNRFRFGFALYHDESSIDQCIEILSTLKTE